MSANRASATKPTTVNGGNSATIVSDPYPDLRLAIPVLTIGILAAALFLLFGWMWYWTVAAIVVAMIIASAWNWRAFIPADEQCVREEARLFGFRLPAMRIIPLSDFEAVVVQHIKGGVEEAVDSWRVGLKRRSGRRIWMRNYERNSPLNSDPERAAGEFALLLSAKMNLPIHDHCPQPPEPWLRRVKLR